MVAESFLNSMSLTHKEQSLCVTGASYLKESTVNKSFCNQVHVIEMYFNTFVLTILAGFFSADMTSDYQSDKKELEHEFIRPSAAPTISNTILSFYRVQH